MTFTDTAAIVLLFAAFSGIVYAVSWFAIQGKRAAVDALRRRCYFSRTVFWCRLWPDGPGVMGRHRSERPYFSERNGYQKFYPAWPSIWRFGHLKQVRRYRAGEPLPFWGEK